MNELLTKNAAELAELLQAKQISSEELTTACFDRIAEVDTEIHAFLAIDQERALKKAREIDELRSTGKKLPTLAGVPVALKDNFCYQGLPTTCGSKMLQNWIPPYNATVTKRLIDNGLIILGKTNMDEFAMGSSTETSAFGVTRNPWDLTRIPGGSGGGSAASLASFQAPLAIGSDTGGSIRQPASVTGTVGVKPTYGGTSRYGNVAMASSLDVPGPCARSVLDAALLHKVIAGYDYMDSTSIDAPVPPVVEASKNPDIKGMKIGVVKELGGEGYQLGVEQRFNEIVELLSANGAEIIEVSCPNFEYALAVYYLIMPAEVSSNLARFDAMRYGLRVGDDGLHTAQEVTAITRGQGFGEEVKRRVILGTYALSSGYYDAYYGTAQKVRTLIAQDFQKAFEQCEALISPATPTVAFKIGERMDDPLAMYKADLCTIPANLAGNSAASFPAGLTEGLPVGIQVMAPPMADDQVYRVGALVEQVLQQNWKGPLLSSIPTLPEMKVTK